MDLIREFLCVMILQIPLCHSTFNGTYYFIELQNNVTYDAAVDLCKSNYNSIPSYVYGLEQCTQNSGTGEVYWLPVNEDVRYPMQNSDWSCEFEEEDSNCFMYDETGGNFDWKKKSGYTPTWDTGPKEAFQGSVYLYMEATRAPRNQKFIISSLTLSEDTYCLSFHYHMYGSGIGSLSVNLTSFDLRSNKLWERHGQQNDRHHWLHALVDVNVKTNNSKIKIIGTKGSNTGDIAIDDVRLKYGDCSFYSELSEINCGDILFGDNGTILSPYYPHSYPSNIECSWKITAVKGKVITLHVNDFHLEKEYIGDCYDSLSISESDEDVLGIFCENMLVNANVIQSTSNVVSLKLHTDGSITEKGFNISWTTELVYCSSAMINKDIIDQGYRPCGNNLSGVICFSDTNTPNKHCEYLPKETMTQSTAKSTSNTNVGNTNAVTIGYEHLQKGEKSDPSSGTSIGIGVSFSILISVAVVVVVIILLKHRRTKLSSIYEQQSGSRPMSTENPVYQQQDVYSGVHSTDDTLEPPIAQHTYLILAPDINDCDRQSEKKKGACDNVYENSLTDDNNYANYTLQDDEYNHLHGVNLDSTHPDDKYDHVKLSTKENSTLAEDNYDHLGVSNNSNDTYDVSGATAVTNTDLMYSETVTLD